MGEVVRVWLKSQLPAERRGVCRTLFGPVDHEETARFVRDEMTKMRQQDSERWNFEFESDRPYDNGRYRWSPAFQRRRASDDGESSGNREVSAPKRCSEVATESPKHQQQTRMTDFLRKRKTGNVPKSSEPASALGDKLQRRASS